ncbi:MAG TPA: hypothetical protein ENH07_03090 [Nitrospirae bacterium]|nr:hypothetical protein [Nitrospirota bacterium]
MKINSGICGFSTVVKVEKKAGKKFAVTVSSECEMVQKLGAEMPELEFMDAFKRITDNPVYVRASVCLKHVSCPVPSGVLKVLEVEAGLAVPKDVHMEFIKEDD